MPDEGDEGVVRAMPEDPHTSRWLSAMTGGIIANSSLLSVAIPRASPEGVAVVAAAQGLVENIGDEEWVVRVEGQGRDLVVENSDGSASHWFAFKALWSNGLGECVNGIRVDIERLEGGDITGAPQRYAVAFSYIVEKCRFGCEDRLTRGTLDELTSDVIELPSVGARTVPPLQGKVVFIEGGGTVGQVRLLAWRVYPLEQLGVIA